MTKAQAIAEATGYGLAVYRGDTLATLAKRIADHIRVEAEIEASVVAEEAKAAARGALFGAAARHYRPAGAVQLRLALALPREFSAVCGLAA